MHKKTQRRRAFSHRKSARHVSTYKLQASHFMQCHSANRWMQFGWVSDWRVLYITSILGCDCTFVGVSTRPLLDSVFHMLRFLYLCVCVSFSSCDVLLLWFGIFKYSYLRPTSWGLRAHRTKTWPQKGPLKGSKMTPMTGPARDLLGVCLGACLGGRSRGHFGLPAAVLKEKSETWLARRTESATIVCDVLGWVKLS